MTKSFRTLPLDIETIQPLLINLWRRFHKESGPADALQTREFRRVVEAVKILQAKNDGKESLIGKDYFANRELLSSYVLYQWMIHYQEGMSLLGEIPQGSKRVLDVCSGPAAFAFAALRHGAREVYAVDRNVAALEFGAEICGRYGMPLTVRKWDCTKGPIPIDGNFDLIIVGHSLEELFPTTMKDWHKKRLHFVEYLLKRVDENGFLLLVEGSFPEENQRLLMLREALISQGFAIQAPCVWKGECPALKTPNSPCYAQRDMEKSYLLKEIQRAASIKLGSLKMSYLLVRGPNAAWPSLPEKKLYRVVSPPIESYQGKRFYLCGTDGKKSLTSHMKSHPVESRAFEYLRRGELISVSDTLESQFSYDLIEGSSLKIEAACGKPLPDVNMEDSF